MSHPLRPIFSIELQCIVRYNRAEYLSGLEAVGISKVTTPISEPMLADIVRKYIVSELASGERLVQEDLEPENLKAWTVGSDAAVRHAEVFGLKDEKKGCCDVKLISPFYRCSEKALHEIQDVIQTFDSLFDVLMESPSCGLHVRVGDERTPFDLQTIKNFCILTTSLGPHFSAVQFPEILNEECAERQTARCPGKSPFQIAIEIQKCKSLLELVGLFLKVKGVVDLDNAYNLDSLINGAQIPNIEFQQHEATMDVHKITGWVKLACSLLEYSHNVLFEDLSQLIQDNAFDPETNVADLLFNIQPSSWGRLEVEGL